MIHIYSLEQIGRIRMAGRILAEILEKLKLAAQEGMRPKDLDEMAMRLIQESGAEPAFLGYQSKKDEKPFSAALCVSVNEVVVHAPPKEGPLCSGDVVKLDLGVKYQGYFADSAITLGIGKITPQAQELIQTAKKALNLAIGSARAGNTLGDIGYVVKKIATDHGFDVIKGLTGHGIGKELHEEPQVLNEGERGKGIPIAIGMVLAIEPMLSVGSGKVKQLPDGGFAAVDGSLTAHFEHTVAITERGVEILTVI